MNAPSLTQTLSCQARWPLHSVAQTQSIEHATQATLPAHTLMQRAGLATAQLALAIAPHAKTIWIACGPGNNGGDGLEAAIHLQAWGKNPIVTWLSQKGHGPVDAQQAWHRANAAGVLFSDHPPQHFDLGIDALLGIGAHRAPESILADWLQRLHHSESPVLCVDTPSGLLADTGEWLGAPTGHSHAQRHTLSLLTLKPGLFTAQGRDAAGKIWFNSLGASDVCAPIAWLQQACNTDAIRPHNSHKGSYGDVAVIGGAPGMSGAALLAGMAALHGGAGRVSVGLLDAEASHAMTAAHPALMMRHPESLNLQASTVVCGCGGGDALQALLPHVLSASQQLVLDADALNAIAGDTALQTLLKKRHARHKPTVLTPHPLEAARLLNCSVSDVQHNRLHAAQKLADAFHCVLVLKGSGSVVTRPNDTAVINYSGNALLATAGTGDVLAGFIGAKIARSADVFAATCQAVFKHGHIADTWPQHGPAFDAAQLAAALR